jgi:hypothetical protein
MQCSETGSQEVVRLPYLKLTDAKDINDAIGDVAERSHAEGRVSFNILRGGFISVLEVMIRKINRRERAA